MQISAKSLVVGCLFLLAANTQYMLENSTVNSGSAGLRWILRMLQHLAHSWN